ncbi:MAG: hypothetical protein M1361_01405 [Patescibacteria group bacterium]|nr:hypothetical protein [Patescibacteria group bacterium]MCL5224256.1 hypothetical protein [Patescibacteria group bacterium]
MKTSTFFLILVGVLAAMFAATYLLYGPPLVVHAVGDAWIIKNGFTLNMVSMDCYDNYGNKIIARSRWFTDSVINLPGVTTVKCYPYFGLGLPMVATRDDVR